MVLARPLLSRVPAASGRSALRRRPLAGVPALGGPPPPAAAAEGARRVSDAPAAEGQLQGAPARPAPHAEGPDSGGGGGGGGGAAAHEVFRCSGLRRAALQMRRRVQLGIALELAGTQLTNLLILHPGLGNSASFEAMSVFTDSANAMVALHVFVVWRYYVFLRDALMARHVTRIALERPRPAAAEGPASLPGGPVADAPLAEAGPLAVLVETGPWARRLELRPAPASGPAAGGSGAGAAPGEQRRQTPFGQLLQVGVLHVDRLGGETLDPEALRQLLDGDLLIAKEEVEVDVPSAREAYVDAERLAPFLMEASGDSFARQLAGSPRLLSLMQFRGDRLMSMFGLLALGMGAGSVGLWAVRR